MKKTFISSIINLILLISAPAFADTAVLPYRLMNPSASLGEELSLDYAKLVAVASSIKKGVAVYSFSQLEIELKNLAINPRGLVTQESLELLARIVSTDYILLGSLSKIPKGFKSESILYSAMTGSVTSKSSVTSSNLFELAEKEIDEIYFQVENAERPGGSKSQDAVIVTDLSFNVSADWDSIKDGMKKFAEAISGNWSTDTVIHLIPVSENYPKMEEYLQITSGFRLTNVIDKLKPRGGASGKTFNKCLSRAVNNISWRKESNKILFVVSNTPVEDGQFLDKYASIAKLKGIKIFTLSLGLLKHNDLEYLRQLSVTGRGAHAAAAYKQRLFNIDGKPMDIFYEAGRLFQSLINDSRWKEGLFYGVEESRSWNTRRPISYLDEIIYDSIKYQVKPANIAEMYPLITQSKIINSGQIENNIVHQMKKIGDASLGISDAGKPAGYFGRAMLTDGKISLWINILSAGDLEFFERKNEDKLFFPVGVSVRVNQDEVYGITFNPSQYITNLTGEYIPRMLKTDIKKIVSSPEYFMSEGLLRPPVWFIDVRVDMVESNKKIYDVRESMEQ